MEKIRSEGPPLSDLPELIEEWQMETSGNAYILQKSLMKCNLDRMIQNIIIILGFYCQYGTFEEQEVMKDMFADIMWKDNCPSDTKCMCLHFLYLVFEREFNEMLTFLFWGRQHNHVDLQLHVMVKQSHVSYTKTVMS